MVMSILGTKVKYTINNFNANTNTNRILRKSNIGNANIKFFEDTFKEYPVPEDLKKNKNIIGSKYSKYVRPKCLRNS